MDADPTVIVAVSETGRVYIRPGTTVGQLLELVEALRGLALNIQINTQPTNPPA